MLTRVPNVEKSFYSEGAIDATCVRNHADATRAANIAHDPTDIFSGENADDLREVRLVDGVVVLILSSFAGFCSAIFAAILGSGVFMAFLIYLGVSFLGLFLVLALSYFRSDANEADAELDLGEDLVEFNVTKTEHTIHRENRRRRFRFYLALTAVLSTLVVTDHWAVISGVGLCSMLGVLWSSISRKRAMMLNTIGRQK